MFSTNIIHLKINLECKSYNTREDILNNHIESSDDIHSIVGTTEIRIDLNDDVNSSNTFERSDTKFLVHLIILPNLFMSILLKH